ncbi:MAG: chemotaxis protein [Thermoguttaceae bacterium]|nr:chemotaxis protein [Thermoguttaceae bacterium]MDW8078745.1 chemotaxis protein [Thermoguttaceae bacterium]
MESAIYPCASWRERISIFRQLLTSATREASVAMSRWVGEVIDLELEDVQAVPLEAVSAQLGLDESVSVLVVLTLRPPLAGEILLHFDQQSARALAAALTGVITQQQECWSELERSALLETGNILGCAYVNALSRMIDHELVPSAPTLVCDFAQSVLQQALALQLQYSDYVVVSRTRFTRGDQNLSWWVLFLPSPELQETMNRSLRPVISRCRSSV